MTEKVKITSARDLLGDVQDAATNAEKLRQITLLTHHEDREDQDRWERHAEARSSAQELGLISRRLTDLFRDRPEDEHAGGRTYRGSRKGHCLAEVTVSFRSRDGETVTDQLSSRQELLNRFPDGFEWGYAGSGPAQLALAILADATRDEEYALRRHQDFKREVISKIRGRSWTMEGADVAAWSEDHP